MTTAVQLRRGTTAEHATFTGLEGETTVDTTKTTLVVHNGSTAGGFAIAREDLANVTPTNLPTITGDATAADDKFLIYDQSALTLKQITRAELNNAIEQDPLSNVQIVSGTINGTTIGGTTAAGGSFTTLNSSGATTLNGTTIPSSVTLVSRAATQTLTNKTISGANNTLSNIGNASLTNNSINFTYSGGVTGSASAALGGTNALSLSNVPNASLQNSSITFGSTAQALGSTVSALNGVSIGATTASTGAFTDLAYTGTLTGGTGVINIGSGQLYKDASGNVGIGTSSPAASRRLTIQNSATDNAGMVLNDSNGVQRCQVILGGAGAGSSSQSLFINATTDILLNTGTVERIRVTSAGVVLVGTTTIGSAQQASAGTLVVDQNIMLSTGRVKIYGGDIGTVTATTGQAIFTFENSTFTTNRTCLVKLTISQRAASNTPSVAPQAVYYFMLHNTTAGVCTINGDVAIYQYEYVKATHFSFANLGSGVCTVSLLNPKPNTLTGAYTVEIVSQNAAWRLNSVTTT
jgi:hypothetical protein